jgi:hypothetical protein
MFSQWMWLCFLPLLLKKQATSKEASKYLSLYLMVLCKILYLVLHDFFMALCNHLLLLFLTVWQIRLSESFLPQKI